VPVCQDWLDYPFDPISLSPWRTQLDFVYFFVGEVFPRSVASSALWGLYCPRLHPPAVCYSSPTPSRSPSTSCPRPLPPLPSLVDPLLPSRSTRGMTMVAYPLARTKSPSGASPYRLSLDRQGNKGSRATRRGGGVTQRDTVAKTITGECLAEIKACASGRRRRGRIAACWGRFGVWVWHGDASPRRGCLWTAAVQPFLTPPFCLVTFILSTTIWGCPSCGMPSKSSGAAISSSLGDIFPLFF